MNHENITQQEIDSLYETLNTDAEAGGYHLNPDLEVTKGLIEGLIINRKRYGYESCPCRLACENKKEDLDIICPCDYRDPDLSEYGTCYCSLYVSNEIMSGEKKAAPIPERRLSKEERKANAKDETLSETLQLSALPYPVWRCKVCGYLCARDEPPGTCPICKAKKERFEKFIY